MAKQVFFRLSGPCLWIAERRVARRLVAYLLHAEWSARLPSVASALPVSSAGRETEDAVEADCPVRVLELWRKISEMVSGDTSRPDRIEQAIRTLWAPLIATARLSPSWRSGTMNEGGIVLMRLVWPSVGLRLCSTYQCAGGH